MLLTDHFFHIITPGRAKKLTNHQAHPNNWITIRQLHKHLNWPITVKAGNCGNRQQCVNCVTLWELGDISPKISSWSPLLTTDQSCDALTPRDAETDESGNTCWAPGSNSQPKQWSFSFVCHPVVPIQSNANPIQSALEH